MGNMLARAAALVVAALLIIGLAAFVLSDAPREDNDPHILSVNTTNTAEMHTYGMPTKADCMEWHLHGQWGYWRDGTLHAFADLPGGADAWDELYGIEPNPAFVK